MLYIYVPWAGPALANRRPCRQETARCRSCSFRFRVCRHHSLYKFKSSLASKARLQSSKHTGTKQNLTQNGHSRSFKITHFGITEKPTIDCVSLYNNAGLISKVTEGIASEITENYRCRQLHSHLKPPLQRTPANISINLILPETTVIRLHLRCA